MPEKSQRSWQLVRITMVSCWFLWLITFFIAVTLLQAVFQIHVVAQVSRNVEKGYSSFSKDFVHAVPLKVVGDGVRKKIDEMFLRYYLEMRYSSIPDNYEMERRWGPAGVVARLSSYDAYVKANLKYEDAEKMPPVVVDIRSITQTSNLNYQVVVDLYIFDRSKSWTVRTKSLYVAIAYRPSKNFSNPFGFYVVGVDERRSLD